jgi:Protein-tyrosine phosphatase
VDASWEPGTSGLLVLPSGRSVRGRSTRAPVGAPAPQLGLYLAEEAPAVAWPALWVHWRDFRTPTDPEATRRALLEVWERAADQRVEVACRGGRGRTGTALACLAVLDGVPARSAVDFVRRHYHRRAVETPWQKRYVARFDRS